MNSAGALASSSDMSDRPDDLFQAHGHPRAACLKFAYGFQCGPGLTLDAHANALLVASADRGETLGRGSAADCTQKD